MNVRGLALATASLGVAAAVLLWLVHMQAPEPVGAPVPRDAAAAPAHVKPPPRLVVADAGAVEVPGRPGSIHGRLTEYGKPVAGFAVTFRDYYAGALTDAHGAFRIAGIIPGPHTVLAEDRKTGRRASQNIDLAPGEDLEVDLDLAQTGRLHIEVVDQRGAPVANATVTVYGDGATWSYFASDHMQTDEHGMIDRLGLTTGTVTVAAVAGLSTVSDNVLIRGGEQRLRLAFPLRAGLSIAGHVVDDRERPVAAAEVRLASSMEDRVTTNGTGAFRFDGLLEGSYPVTASVGVDDDVRTRVTAGTEDLTLVVPRAGSIDGTVEGFDDASDFSAEGERRVLPLTVNHSTIEKREVSAGRYLVVAYDGMKGTVGSVTVDVRPGETTTIHLRPAPPGGVRLDAVRFPDGSRATGVVCNARGARYMQGNDLGLDHLAPGAQRISCSTRGLSGSAIAQIEADVTTDLRIWLVADTSPQDEKHLGAHFDPATQTFVQVDSVGPASSAGIAVGDRLLAVEGTGITSENADAAQQFMLVQQAPYRVRVRSKGATYAVDLTITPR